VLAALALALACGRPAPIDLPTVAITDDVAGSVAHGNVLFTFTFSTPVLFTADDVVLTGGTKGAFNSDLTVATLVAIPTPPGPGTLTVAVPMSAFRPSAQSNAVLVSASRDYDLPPAVTITDDVGAGAAHDDFVFTFTFSEPVDDNFTADAVAITHGTKGLFTRVSPTVATLAAIPPAADSGQLTVTLPPGAFTDLAGNANVLGANASQDYETTQTNQNGSFADGLTHWDKFATNGGALEIAVQNGALRATIGALGTGVEPVADLQIKYLSGVDLGQGRNYRLTFDAWADAPRTVDTSIWENGHDTNGDTFGYSTYQYDTFQLTTTRQTFTSNLVNMPFNNPDAGFVFFVGASTTGLYIDDVIFTEAP
jgi:hypothetical protein